MELSEIRVGTSFSDVHALVDSIVIAVSKAGKPYADILLKSGNTNLKCKKWSFNTEKYADIIVAGKVVKVSGEAQAYQGELQAILTTVEASDRIPDDFARRTKYDIEKIYQEIRSIIDSFSHDLLKYVASKLLIKYKKEFCSAPAAIGLHQAWFGGLIEHTYNMLCIADAITDVYVNKYGVTKINKDRVLFGIILHDFGKIFEYDSSTPSFKMKPEGVLLNHIMRGAILVQKLADEWYYGSDSDDFTVVAKPSTMNIKEFERERDILTHLIVTHHGKKEFGAPQSPACLEALIIHHVDMLDSHIIPAIELVEGKEGAVEGFSERCKMEKIQYLQ